MHRHINAFLTIAKHERRPVGTFPFSPEGEIDAAHALADARAEARRAGYDLKDSASEIVFVDTGVLGADGKTPHEFTSAGELRQAAQGAAKPEKN